MTTVNVGLAQINSCVGDLNANAEKVLSSARHAYEQGVNLLITPALALGGHPCRDLLLRSDFIEREAATLLTLQKALAEFRGLHVVVGHTAFRDGALYNSASVLVDGNIVACHHRQGANDTENDDSRYFANGSDATVFELNGLKFGLAIGPDIESSEWALATRRQGAQVCVSLNASPYTIEAQARRDACVRQHTSGMAVVYTNLVGGQDEFVFDGASFVLCPNGRIAARLPVFEEALHSVTLDAQAKPLVHDADHDWPPAIPQIYSALKLALHDYVSKSGFTSVLLGLSGGLDSALVLAVAVDVLGPDRVRTIMMPSRYTAQISLADAQQMAGQLGVAYDIIAIDDLLANYEQSLAPYFAGQDADTTEENLQARIRANLLMALSNKFGALVVATGNKSEVATGYATLYGDMAGGFGLLKDVPKTTVYALSRWRNQQSPVIPQRIIDRPPSAELRSDQTDQDSLPPYDELDAIIEHYVDHNETVEQIVRAGFNPAVVMRVARLIQVNEYKRRQGAVGPKITTRAFGVDWRYPVVNGFRD